MTVAIGVCPYHKLCWCVILQAKCHEVLKEMEKALEGNKTLEKLTLTADPTLPKEFRCQFVFGNGPSTSLSETRHFHPESYHCPRDGRMVYVSHMLCDSV